MEDKDDLFYSDSKHSSELESEGLNNEICECPNNESALSQTKDFIGRIDANLEAIDSACHKILNGTSSNYDEETIYSCLKSYETIFGQMSQIALACSNTREIAEPQIEKNQKNPIIPMIEIAGSDFLDNIFNHEKDFYDYLYQKFYKVWPENEHIFPL